MQWIGFTFMVDASRGVFVTGQIVDWTSHSNNSSSQNKCSVGVWTGFSTTLWQIGHINSTQTTQHRTAQYNSLVQWIQGNQTITYIDLYWSTVISLSLSSHAYTRAYHCLLAYMSAISYLQICDQDEHKILYQFPFFFTCTHKICPTKYTQGSNKSNRDNKEVMSECRVSEWWVSEWRSDQLIINHNKLNSTTQQLNCNNFQ